MNTKQSNIVCIKTFMWDMLDNMSPSEFNDYVVEKRIERVCNTHIKTEIIPFKKK